MIVSHPPVRARGALPVRKATGPEADLAEQVARALNRTLANVPMDRIRAVLAASTPQAAADAVARLASLSPGLAELREAAERALGQATAAGAVVEAGRLGFSYQVVPERAILWAQRSAGDLVVAVSGPTRDAIRATVVTALESGYGIPETAKAIRQVVGLHPRWAQAVRRAHAEALAQGSSPEAADRMAQRNRARLVRRRAENIARTEIMRATNEGSHSAWHTAQALGLWGDVEPIREWLIANDERTCPICRPLGGVQVTGLDSTFPGGVVMPPRHPSCRCRVIVVNAILPPSKRPKAKVDPVARRHVQSLKRAVRERANAVRADAAGTLDNLDVARMASPPPKVRTRDALGRTVWTRGQGGEWDWYDSLSDVEQLRVRRNWFSDDFGLSKPDQIAEHFIDAGRAGDFNEAMEKWLDLTRRHDAALAVRRGKLPSERVFGNFDVDDTFGDGTYRVADVLNPDLEEAVQAIARTDADMAGQFADRALVRTTDLPAPWDLSLQDYVEELTELEDLARYAEPVGGDADFGWVYGQGDEATFRRIAELAPPELDLVGSERLSAEDLWHVVQHQAKLAGLK